MISRRHRRIESSPLVSRRSPFVGAVWAAVLCGLFAAPLPVAAQSARPSTQPSRPDSANRANKAVPRRVPQDPAREKAALDFVQRHYPRLMEVLIYLKENNGRQYWRAVNELAKTQSRLAQIRKRSADRYALELESWKLKSEVQLLSARLAMDDSPALREELADAVSRQIDLKIALLQREKSLLTARLKRVDQSLKQLEGKRGEEVERTTEQLVRKIRRMNKPKSARSNRNKRTKKRTESKRKAR